MTLKWLPRRSRGRGEAPGCLLGPGTSHIWWVDTRLDYGHGLWWSDLTWSFICNFMSFLLFLCPFAWKLWAHKAWKVALCQWWAWIQAFSHPEPGPSKVVRYEIRHFGLQTAPCTNREDTNPRLKVFMNIKCKSVWRSNTIQTIASFSFKGVFSSKIFAS